MLLQLKPALPESLSAEVLPPPYSAPTAAATLSSAEGEVGGVTRWKQELLSKKKNSVLAKVRKKERVRRNYGVNY